MSEAYQIIEKKETQRLAAFVAEHGQAFFPLVSAGWLMDVMGRAGLCFCCRPDDARIQASGVPPARQPGGPGDPEGAQA